MTKLEDNYWKRLCDKEQENKVLREEITWWSNRFKAVERDNRKLREKINKAIEYIKEHNVLAVNKEYLPSEIERCCSQELLEILGDKECLYWDL